MGELPEPVKKTLAVIKSKSKHYVFAKFLYSNYRVYEGMSRFDKEKRRSRMTATYLGTIEADGRFVPTTHRPDKSKIAMAPDQIKLEEQKLPELPEELTENDRTALTILSMNGRAAPKLISNMLGMKPQAAQYIVKKLEDKYSIKYFADIAFWKFGLNQFVGFIKFSERIPPVNEIRAALGGDPHIQMVALTSGDYDVFFYFLAESNDEAIDFSYKLRTETKLANYAGTWYISYFFQNYGAMPVRPEFFELLERKVWHRTSETPTKKKDELWRREYIVLKELCRDGAMSFAEIDRRNNLESGSAQYTFSKLKEAGIIRRVTCSLQNLPLKYNALLFAEFVTGKQFASTQNTFLSEMIQYTRHPTNKYILVGETTSPSSLLLIAPIFKDGEIEGFLKLGQIIGGVKVRALTITDVLVGSLCYRLFDNEHSWQWDRLVQNKVTTSKTKRDYEETGRIRKKHIRVEKEQGAYGIRYE